MRLSWIVFLASIVAFGCTANTGKKDYADILIRNVRIVSAQDTSPQTAVDVLVNDGRIVFIGKPDPEQTGDSTTILEGSDRFLIPGLIDGHTHLDEVPGMTIDHEQAYPKVSSAARDQ